MQEPHAPPALPPAALVHQMPLHVQPVSVYIPYQEAPAPVQTAPTRTLWLVIPACYHALSAFQQAPQSARHAQTLLTYYSLQVDLQIEDSVYVKTGTTTQGLLVPYALGIAKLAMEVRI